MSLLADVLFRSWTRRDEANVELLFVPSDGRPALDLTPVCYDLGGLAWSYEVSTEHSGFLVLYGRDIIPSGEGVLRFTPRGNAAEEWPIKVTGCALDSIRPRRRKMPEKWNYDLAVLGPPRPVDTT